MKEERERKEKTKQNEQVERSHETKKKLKLLGNAVKVSLLWQGSCCFSLIFVTRFSSVQTTSKHRNKLKSGCEKKKQTETLWCLCLAVSMSDADKLKDRAFKNPLASPSQTCTSVWPGRLFGIGKKAGQKEVFFVRYISAYPSPRRKHLWTNVIYSLTKSHAYSSKVAPSVLLMLDCAKNRSGFIGCQRQLRQKKGSLAWHEVHGWMQGL